MSQNQPPLYLFSGLGADERMFQKLTLHHPNPQFIQWIVPQKNEPLAAYAQRISTQIKPETEPPILIGLSFGGIVAQEVAKLIPVKKVILLSTLASGKDLPFHYRLGGQLKLQQWLPFGLIRRWKAPAALIFGAKTPEAKQLLSTIIQETDLAFLRWALGQILAWTQERPATNCVIIHGDKDRILPCCPHRNPIVVKGGEHLMLLNQPQEVSALLNQFLG